VPSSAQKKPEAVADEQKGKTNKLQVVERKTREKKKTTPGRNHTPDEREK